MLLDAIKFVHSQKPQQTKKFLFFLFLTFLLQSLEAKPKSPQREGDDLVLICTAQGSSKTTFSWYKNGFLLNITRSIRLVYFVSQVLPTAYVYSIWNFFLKVCWDFLFLFILISLPFPHKSTKLLLIQIKEEKWKKSNFLYWWWKVGWFCWSVFFLLGFECL